MLEVKLGCFAANSTISARALTLRFEKSDFLKRSLAFVPWSEGPRVQLIAERAAFWRTRRAPSPHELTGAEDSGPTDAEEQNDHSVEMQFKTLTPDNNLIELHGVVIRLSLKLANGSIMLTAYNRDDTQLFGEQLFRTVVSTGEWTRIKVGTG